MGYEVVKIKKSEGNPCPQCHSTDRKGEKGFLKLSGIKVFSLVCPVCGYKVHPRYTRENDLGMGKRIKISQRLHGGINPYRKYRSAESLENARSKYQRGNKADKSVRT